MARAHYFVSPHGEQWKVALDEKPYYYVTKAIAVRAAVDAAHQSGKANHDAQVLVQGANGQFQTEWTYGHDPYPPKG